MKPIVAVSSKRDACKSFSTLDCHEECLRRKGSLFSTICQIKVCLFSILCFTTCFLNHADLLTLLPNQTK